MDLRKLFSGSEFPPETLRFDEPLAPHTSFKIGGRADLMILPRTKEQLLDAFATLRENSIACFIMGGGNNLLVSDAGYRGVVIKTENMTGLNVSEREIHIEAGVSLARVFAEAAGASLTGFEFASGIPGSFGGAVCMNAGAYGGEIKDVLVQAEVVDLSGKTRVLSNAQAELSYRDSKIMREGLIVLSGVIALQPGDADEIKARAADFNKQRREKQPLEFPSAGSVFKRPPGHFAGKLIEDAGLAGFSVGGAMVSPKHCGFLVNTGGAAAKDVIELISHVRTTVKDRFGIELEPEIRMI